MSENAAETPEKSSNAFTAFEHYDDFKGEATLSEFWSFFFLVHVIVLILMIPGLPIYFQNSDTSAANNWHAPLALALPIIVWGLIVLIPLVSVLIRRMRNSMFGLYTLAPVALLFILCVICRWLRPETDVKWLIFWFFEISFVMTGCLPEKKKSAL